MPSYLADPHHDGSALYVSTQTPLLGDTVQIRLRVPAGRPVDEVHVRTAPDGEQEFVQARRIADPGEAFDADKVVTADEVGNVDDAEQWWQADVRCHNPVTNYRFLLSYVRDAPSADREGGPPAYQWLNGMGLHQRDVPDAADFRLVTYPAPPSWATGSVVYQVFPDRFARDVSAEPHERGGPREDLPEWAHPAAWDEPVDGRPETGPQQVFGGTLRGVIEHLDHICDLGVNVIYLTPFFPARSNHRYDAVSFDEVDPILGGTEALLELQHAAHERGLVVMGDITTNHTGEEHEWFLAALADPEGDAANWFVRHEAADRDDGYVSWLAVGSLPKLDHSSSALRAAFFDRDDSAIQRWLGPGRGIDGWRVDVANMTGRYRDTDLAHDVARQARRAVDEVGAQRGCEPLLIAEHTHDHSQDALGDGWHGVMNYSAFTKPAWTWLRDHNAPPQFLGAPVPLPRLSGELVVEAMREFAAIVPWRTIAHSFTLLGSHDTTRIKTLVGGDTDLVHLAAGLLLTMPGLPMVTYGDEIGMPGDFGEDGRRPMPWSAKGDASAEWDDEILAIYHAFIEARRGTVALHSGGLRWLHTEEDAVVFVREHPSGSALVHLARAGHRDIELAMRHLPGIAEGHALLGPPVEWGEDCVILAASGPTVRVWLWAPPAPEWV